MGITGYILFGLFFLCLVWDGSSSSGQGHGDETDGERLTFLAFSLLRGFGSKRSFQGFSLFPHSYTYLYIPWVPGLGWG